MTRRLARVDLRGPAGRLEGLLLQPPGAPRGAALVCHAHPQHGGTMHTKAVYHTARALENCGFAVLRFNFRGVGRSAGRFDGGRGELQDARAAVHWLAARQPHTPLVLGGFSFGAGIALRVGAAMERVHALVGVGPALDLDDFEFLIGTSKPVLLVAGGRDPLCPPHALEELQRKLGDQASVAILPGAGHLLHERFPELEETVQRFLAAVLPG